ncbi:MAG: acyl-CoA dehydrogenase [Alphaproteobacteria bacterium]|nr:acyl-CoA dehydrogenase [Alphaproteobacteria bacterium]
MSALDDFGLSEEQRLIQANVDALLARLLPPATLRDLDDKAEFPFAAYAALAEGGFVGLPFTSAFGGADGGRGDLVALVEAIGRHSVSMASGYLSTVVYSGMYLQHGGSEFLRRRYLPRLCKGEIRGAFALSEPDTGSDASGIKTRATPSGNGYVLDGQKLYITCAHVADYLVVVAKTNAEAKHKGVSLFWVDAKAEGVSIRPLRMLGRHSSHPNEVFLDKVFVPADHVIGETDRGWGVLMKGLGLERLCVAAASCGNMRHIIDYAKAYAQERHQFGQPISRFQVIQHKFADMQIMYRTSRAMTYRVAAMLDAGLDPVEETAIAKAYVTECNFKCADLGLQIMGGAGYTMDHDMQRFFRDSRVSTIAGGSSEIQRNIIAKTMGL